MVYIKQGNKSLTFQFHLTMSQSLFIKLIIHKKIQVPVSLMETRHKYKSIKASSCNGTERQKSYTLTRIQVSAFGHEYKFLYVSLEKKQPV